MFFTQVFCSSAHLAASRRCHRLALALVAWLALPAATVLLAELPHARLQWVYPPGGQQGTSVDVTISGVDLDEASSLMFSHPGITAAAKMAAPTADGQPPQPLPGQFAVNIAGNVPSGVYDCRALGHYGLSTPRAFSVGRLREVIEQGSNNAIETPMPIELNSTVNGRGGNDSFDVYSFTASAGQRVLVGCQALRVDSRMDATLVLRDESGNRLGYSRDARRNEPMIDFTVPADGTYLVQVYDFTFRGGEAFFYRLSVSTQPHLDFVFPPAGVPGTTGHFTLYGRNLPGGTSTEGITVDGIPLEKVEVEVAIPADPQGPDLPLAGSFVAPADAEARGFEYRLESEQGISNPIFIAFATAEVVPEQEPNDQRAQPQRIALPGEVVGQFFPRRDQDWFSFEAKQGEQIAIEVFSQRWGLPTDPSLLVQHVSRGEQGEEQLRDVAESDDLESQFENPPFDAPRHDAALVFTADADGMYRVLVRDLYAGSNPDPRHVYRLKIGPPRPDFHLLATFKQFAGSDPNQVLTAAPILRPGGTELAVVQLYRSDGFDGSVTLTASGLPEGVSCPPVVIPAGQNRVTIGFAAAEGAVPWSGAIQIVGTSQIDGQEVRREALGSCVVWDKNNANETTYARLTSDVMLSVIAEPKPISVAVVDQASREVSRAGKLSIPVALTRRGDVNGPINLDAQGLPKEIQAATLTFSPEAQGAHLQITVGPNAPIGPISFYLAGQAKVAYRRNLPAAQAAEQEKAAIETDVFVQSLPVTIHVAAAPIALSATPPAAAIPQGGEGQITVQMERRFDFADPVDLQAELLGGASGIQILDASIAADQTDASLAVKVAPDAAPGSREVLLRATLKYNGQSLQVEQPLQVKVEAGEQVAQK